MDEEEAKGQSDYDIVMSDEYVLTDVEKNFILAAERGDCSTVRRLIQENTNKPNIFNINCVDPLNRSALISAIENENYDLIVLLLDEGIQVGDALLHAISEEYVEAVEELLQWEEQNHKEGDPYSWEAVDRSKSNFTPDITPLILAAHRNNYEILKILLDRGATLPMPHDVKCGCDDCVTSQETDSLRYSQSRINAYRALSASSLIALSSRDPVLTAFQLSWELKRLQAMESEFRVEYTEMREGVQQFVTSLLDHARTSTELEIMLNYNHEIGTDIWIPGQRQTLDRLKLAIKYKQKMFVAHPNVQQLLAAIWYEGLPGFRRKTPGQQVMDVAKLGCMFPVYSMNYLMNPDSDMGKFMKKPFVKFISYSSSYAIFLMLLTASSLRVVQMMFDMVGFPWMLEMLDNWKRYERGGLPGPIELGIIMYIGSLIFGELTALYTDGLLDYICDLWNIVDFISNMFYVTWILCRVTSWIIVHRDLWYRGIDPYFPREHWHPFDPMLLSEGAFAAGMIFSFLKLVHIFSINPHLGPLQVSLGRMIIDIIKFFFIYTLVLFAFACGFNQLLWYYADLEKHKCYHLHPEVADFDDQEKACTIWRRFANLFETSQSLFWASFGLVDLVSFDLAGIKSFTRFWALLLFGSYSVINIIVLLNMLIAMMSNSYQIISERADTEWKFARSQLWMSYFEDGGTVPPPFNICPSMKLLKKTLGREKKRTKSFMRKTRDKAQEMHDKVMKLLVRRYVTAEQRKRDDFGITEDDIIEVRQDISSLRFELLDIFQSNKMAVPDIDKKQANNAGTKKGKVLERRILKDFQIGFVEGLAAEMTNEPGSKDVFGSIAKVIGKGKSSTKGGDSKKKDWNAIARKNTMSQDPIGSKRSSLQRRSKRSLRRQIIDEANAGLKMDTDQIAEYNPKLVDEKPATRVAYVKFMQKTLTKREESDLKEKEEEKSEPKAKSVRLQAMKSIRDVKSAAPTPPTDVQKDDGGKSSDTTSPFKSTGSGVNFKDLSKQGENSKDAEKPGETKPHSLLKKHEEKLTVVEPAVKNPAPSVPKSDTNAKGPDAKSTDKKATVYSKETKPEAPKPPGAKPADPKSTDMKPENLKNGDKKASEEKTKTDGKKSDDKPADGKSADGKSSDGKPADGKPADGKPADGKPADGKPADTKSAETKPSDSTSTNEKSGDSKPSDDKTKSSTSGAKPDDKPPAEKAGEQKPSGSKPDDKKPPPPKPVGQSAAAAGGDRGKSTVTGRMISGWL